ncbi:PREDICTED: uncharacterized protein LOC103905967 [Aptenodytes forsteri]|uniref:uncharacterized protein LOC103905967 n=1 Tax=Aptenodytes forsteri TaxID=9233 RepID=UPI0004F4B381|nr:PREDICTED: uncharacterized protein LOC103905967 [Aptenodytes forsteri]
MPFETVTTQQRRGKGCNSSQPPHRAGGDPRQHHQPAQPVALKPLDETRWDLPLELQERRRKADAVGRARLPPRRPGPPPTEGGGEALAAGQHGGDVPGGGRDRGQGGDPGERPPASDPAAEPAGPGAGGVRLRPLRLPGGRLGAEGRGGRRRPRIGSAEEADDNPLSERSMSQVLQPTEEHIKPSLPT